MGVTICTLRDPGDLEGAGEGTPLNPGSVSTQPPQDAGSGGEGGYKVTSPAADSSEPIAADTSRPVEGGGTAAQQPTVAPSEVSVQVPPSDGAGGGAELEGID